MAQGASGRGLALTLARDGLAAPALTTGGRLLCRRDAAVSGAVGIRAGARSEGARGGTRACYAHDSRASRCLAGRKAVPTLGPRQLAQLLVRSSAHTRAGIISPASRSSCR